MLFCNTCGQCSHITDDKFIQLLIVKGWEKNLVDPDTGEIIDYIEGSTEESDHYCYYCPFCNSTDTETEWNGTEKEALILRREFIDKLDKDSPLRAKSRLDLNWDT